MIKKLLRRKAKAGQRKAKPSFVVNSATGAQQFRVNVSTSVQHSLIREEVYNGRVMMVIPSKTLPDNIVMNDMLYPASEIAKSYMTLEGTPAPLGHPIVNGEYVSASHPEAYLHNVGAFNKSVRRENGSVYIEKWIDKAHAEKVAPELMSAINEGKPISTSTGLLCERVPVTGKPYRFSASNMRFDHDAILLNEAPAAGVDQGVGMLVNKEFVINSVLDDSERDKREQLSALLPVDAYLSDYDDKTVVYEVYDGNRDVIMAVDYQITDGVATTTADPYNVKRVTVWERISAALNLKNPVQVETMNEEQIAAMMTANAEQAKASANAVAALTEQVSKLGESLTKIQADQAASAELAVNAALADKRKVVAAVMGEMVANALTGEALDEAVAKCQSADGVKGGFTANSSNELGDLSGYEKE